MSSRVGRLHHLIERGRQEDGPDLILKSDLTKIAATEVKLARLDGSLTLLVQRDVDAPGRRSTPPAYGVGKRQLCEEDRQGDWTWLARVTETNGADADGVSMPAYVASVLCVVVMWELAIRPRSISSPTHTRLLARLLIHSLTLSFSSSPPCTHSLTRSHTQRPVAAALHGGDEVRRDHCRSDRARVVRRRGGSAAQAHCEWARPATRQGTRRVLRSGQGTHLQSTKL